METFLGVRFLASEYAAGKTHRGRIDSLGLDENGCPVIVEYKRHSNENVINQGLFYLDWLLDHKAEFRWLMMEKLGRDVADSVQWAGTRLLCIAAASSCPTCWPGPKPHSLTAGSACPRPKTPRGCRRWPTACARA